MIAAYTAQCRKYVMMEPFDEGQATVMWHRRLFISTYSCAAAIACAWSAGPIAAKQPVDFRQDVAPILGRHCIRCHQPANKKSGLSLATFADLKANEYVLAGDPDGSYLIDVVTAGDGKKPLMPKEGAPLSSQAVSVLRNWIRDGAQWPASIVVTDRAKADQNWWSLLPLAVIEPPSAGIPAEWRANPIDRFIYAKLGSTALQPNPPADRRTLIRRVTYDLTGLPPTPDEIESFVQDSSPNAYEKLVDRLLASPRYGEQWGRHWLDVARFGESSGYEVNYVIDNAWPYRDYVIRSFNDDKPFDRFVMEQLAGDSIGGGKPNVEIGLEFLVCGPFDVVGNQDPAQSAQIRANSVDEMIRATGAAFLGLTIGCARCHDHKFDPIKQRDYYQLYATFAGVFHDNEGGNNVHSDKIHRARFEQPAVEQHVFERGDSQRKGEPVVPASMSTLEKATKGFQLSSNAPEPLRRKTLAEWLVARDNPLTPRVLVNRLWQFHFGTGIVATPNDFGYMGERPAHPELLDWLAKRLVADGWRLKAIHKLIVTSQTYQQSSAYQEVAAKIDADSRLLWRFPPSRLSAEEIRDSILFIAGKLDEHMGGPGFRLYQYTRDNVATYTPLETFGPETYRRAVYHQNVRASRIDLLSDFDAPDCAFSTSRRVPTTTPAQALALLNHNFTMTMADALSQRLAANAGDANTKGQIILGFKLACGREPSAEELSAAFALVDKYGMRAFCRALLNSSEFIYVN
jgi:mono/diheme cytochrome c family protein